MLLHVSLSLVSVEHRGEAERYRRTTAQASRGGSSVLDGRLPKLGEGGREGKWVGPGREKSQPFELPRQHPLGPQETAPQMSLPEARAGGGGGCLTPATLMLAV